MELSVSLRRSALGSEPIDGVELDTAGGGWGVGVAVVGLEPTTLRV